MMDNGNIPKHLRMSRMSKYYKLFPFSYKKVSVISPATSYYGMRYEWEVYYNGSLIDRVLTLKQVNALIKEKANT